MTVLVLFFVPGLDRRRDRRRARAPDPRHAAGHAAAAAVDPGRQDRRRARLPRPADRRRAAGARRRLPPRRHPRGRHRPRRRSPCSTVGLARRHDGRGGVAFARRVQTATRAGVRASPSLLVIGGPLVVRHRRHARRPYRRAADDVVPAGGAAHDQPARPRGRRRRGEVGSTTARCRASDDGSSRSKDDNDGQLVRRVPGRHARREARRGRSTQATGFRGTASGTLGGVDDGARRRVVRGGGASVAHPSRDRAMSGRRRGGAITGAVGADDGAAAMTLGELGRLGDAARAPCAGGCAPSGRSTPCRSSRPSWPSSRCCWSLAGWVLPWPWTEWAALRLVVLRARRRRRSPRPSSRAPRHGGGQRRRPWSGHARRLRHRARDPRRRRALRDRASASGPSASPPTPGPPTPCRCDGGVGRLSSPPPWPPRRAALALVANPQDARRRQDRAAEAAADRRLGRRAGEPTADAPRGRPRERPTPAAAARRAGERAAAASTTLAAAEALARRAAAELAREQTPESLATKAATQASSATWPASRCPGPRRATGAAAQFDALPRR